MATIMVCMHSEKPSIYDRIQSAMRARGRTESDRAFCRRLGLSETYLSALSKRCQEDPDCSIDTANATRIAHDLGMTVDQLLGNPPPPSSDPYIGRTEAINAARTLEYSERAIDSVRLDDPGYDPGVLWWFKRIEAEELRLSIPPSRNIRQGTQLSRGRDGSGKR